MTTLSLAPAVRSQQLQVMAMHWVDSVSSQGIDADQGRTTPQQLRAVRGPASHPLVRGEAANVAAGRVLDANSTSTCRIPPKQAFGNAACQRGATTPGRSNDQETAAGWVYYIYTHPAAY